MKAGSKAATPKKVSATSSGSAKKPDVVTGIAATVSKEIEPEVTLLFCILY